RLLPALKGRCAGARQMAVPAGGLIAARHAGAGKVSAEASGLLDAEAEQGAGADRQFHGRQSPALSRGRRLGLRLPCRAHAGARRDQSAGGGKAAGAAGPLAALRCRTTGKDEGGTRADSRRTETLQRYLRDRLEVPEELSATGLSG